MRNKWVVLEPFNPAAEVDVQAVPKLHRSAAAWALMVVSMIVRVPILGPGFVNWALFETPYLDFCFKLVLFKFVLLIAPPPPNLAHYVGEGNFQHI